MKRLVVCCDGTWNRPDAKSPTNVARIKDAVADHDGDTRQLVHYHEGVGTGAGLDRYVGGGFGWGLSRNVRDAYAFVVEEYAPGDQLYFFGFSRGAYTARSAVGLIRNAGILRREHADRIDEAYELYRGRGDDTHPNGDASKRFRAEYSHDDIAVRFVGVWDTVGALGIPGVPRFLAGRLWAFHDTQLSSRVELACQALAIDEKRRPFVPSLWYRAADDDRLLEQRWFAGVHSDVGGGYPERGLADITLWWLIDRARAAGLAFKDDHPVLGPNVDGPCHDSFRPLYWPLGPHTRPFVDDKKPKFTHDGVKAASTATARKDYDPANLLEYLAGGGEVGEIALPEGDPLALT
jgi:uncharacterized protein (DUF2235 family)